MKNESLEVNQAESIYSLVGLARSLAIEWKQVNLFSLAKTIVRHHRAHETAMLTMSVQVNDWIMKRTTITTTTTGGHWAGSSLLEWAFYHKYLLAAHLKAITCLIGAHHPPLVVGRVLAFKNATRSSHLERASGEPSLWFLARLDSSLLSFTTSRNFLQKVVGVGGAGLLAPLLLIVSVILFLRLGSLAFEQKASFDQRTA